VFHEWYPKMFAITTLRRCRLAFHWILLTQTKLHRGLEKESCIDYSKKNLWSFEVKRFDLIELIL